MLLGSRKLWFHFDMRKFYAPLSQMLSTHTQPSLSKIASINNGIPNEMTGESTVLFGLSISIFTGLTLDHVIVLTTDRTSQIHSP